MVHQACLRAPHPAEVPVPAAFLGAGNPLRPELSHHKAAPSSVDGRVCASTPSPH